MVIKERDGIKEVEKVCEAILKLQTEDFIMMDEIAQGQCNYNSPLRIATARWQNELGVHNKQVIEILKNLHGVLKNGATIQKP